MESIERQIQFYNKVNITDVYIKHLELQDCIDNLSDVDTSFKLVNKDGDILLLIECMPLDIWIDGDSKGDKGCFIRRFEYYVDAPCQVFFKQFITAVKFKMTNCNEGFLSYYKYVWTKISKNRYSLINECLNFDKQIDDCNQVIHYERF